MKKIRFICILCVLLISLTIVSNAENTGTEEYVTAGEVIGEQTEEFEDIAAKAALLVDAETGLVLYDLNGDSRQYPASCTKIMTCLLALESIESGKLTMDDMITAGEHSQDGLTWDSSTQNIIVGETMSVKDLIYCMMLSSANEAANILAEAVSGSIEEFISAMNEKALALGCQDTNFVNPHGMHSDEHYTTAKDLYLITKAAWEYPDFRTIVGSYEYITQATNINESRYLYNSNMLLRNPESFEPLEQDYYYEYAVGVKTGSTDAAGKCLVSAAQKDGRTLIAVVLGAENVKAEDGTITDRMAFNESRRLLSHGFDDFGYVKAVSIDRTVCMLPVVNRGAVKFVEVRPAQDVYIGLATGLTWEDFTYEFNMRDFLTAPVCKGINAGTMTVSYGGLEYARVDLTVSESMELTPMAEKTDGGVKAFFSEDNVDIIVLAGIGILVFALFVVMFIIMNKKRENQDK